MSNPKRGLDPHAPDHRAAALAELGVLLVEAHEGGVVPAPVALAPGGLADPDRHLAFEAFQRLARRERRGGCLLGRGNDLGAAHDQAELKLVHSVGVVLGCKTL
eukprot:scaffold35286_cov30-Prasinocladus_malaysianus.AAC.1